MKLIFCFKHITWDSFQPSSQEKGKENIHGLLLRGGGGEGLKENVKIKGQH